MNTKKTKSGNIFIPGNFLLNNRTAENLYHDYASGLPIIDYHCHLPVEEIAADRKFENLTRIWLYGDHYKWRAMRTNGVDEKYITGDASDKEKFLAWANTVPDTLCNPLYHWTHMELKTPFGISDKLLNDSTGEEIWNLCNELLQEKKFSARGLLRKFNVTTVCTTDDPLDSLEHHQKIKEDKFEIKVLPAFRPDKAMMIENKEIFYTWFARLQEMTKKDIISFSLYIDAIEKRHDHFHQNGCRLSDHGLEALYAEEYTVSEIESIFEKIMLRKDLHAEEVMKFKSAMMYEFGIMNREKNWVQQLHLGALRNNNTRRLKELGPDTGYDSIGDFAQARSLSRFFNKLEMQNKLTKTIIYNLNPSDNAIFSSMIGNFQDGKIPGKLQFGSAWWFLDQKDGIEDQIKALSRMGLLSRFIGMTTDSRSFLSYPRHEYFRRILCNFIGHEVEQGLIPDSEDLLKPFIQNICYYNAHKYFNF